MKGWKEMEMKVVGCALWPLPRAPHPLVKGGEAVSDVTDISTMETGRRKSIRGHLGAERFQELEAWIRVLRLPPGGWRSIPQGAEIALGAFLALESN